MKKTLVVLMAAAALAATTLATPVQAVAAGPASCAVAVGNQGQYEIRWEEAASPQARYVILRYVNGAGPHRRAVVERGTDAYETRSYTDLPPRSPNASVSYIMRSKEESDRSRPSADVSCSWTERRRPDPPAAPSVSDDGDGTLSVAWSPVPGVTGYEIYRDVNDAVASGPSVDWPKPKARVGPAVTSWSDPDVFPNDNPHTYRIVAVTGNETSPMSDKGVGRPNKGADEFRVAAWRTAEINGRWEILDPAGRVVQWEAVNVRGHSFKDAALDAGDVARLAERFNYVRLNLAWQYMQPTNGGPIDAGNGRREADRALRFLDLLAAHNARNPGNQVHVILDFAHLGNSTAQFWIPTWAWNAGRAEAIAAGVRWYEDGPDPTPADKSWYAWAGVDRTGSRVISYIDALADYGILDHDTVIALEFMNEPQPRNGRVHTAATQRELATVYASIVDHIRTSSNPNIDNDTLIVLGAFYGGTRFGGTIDANGNFEHNEMAAQFGDATNLIWTAHNYAYGDNTGDDRNDGQRNDGRRGAVGWVENPLADAGCYSQKLVGREEIVAGWDCRDGHANRGRARDGLRNTALWNQRYAQAAGMPFFLGEWGVPRQRYIASGYRGLDGSELYFCDALAGFEDPDGDPNTVDPIHWAVWSFDARIDGFGLYMSQSHDVVGKEFLVANQWVDRGEFPSSQLAWRNYNRSGYDWTYALPFSRSPAGCRQ